MKPTSVVFAASLLFIVSAVGLGLTGDLDTATESAQLSQLLDRAKELDGSLDFRTLRKLYSRSDGFNPYASLPPARRVLDVAISQKRYDQAMESCRAILEQYFIDSSTHQKCSQVSKKLKDKSAAKYHSFVGKGLLRSVLTSGNGRSASTAYEVVAQSEIVDVLNHHGFVVSSHDRKHIGKSEYDVIGAIVPETGHRRLFYFNIDLMSEAYVRLDSPLK